MFAAATATPSTTTTTTTGEAAAAHAGDNKTRSAVIPTLGWCRIPAFGFGTYQLYGSDCTNAVRYAIQSGYRLLDTAAGYKNEHLVAEGIRSSGVAREELFVIVKIFMNTDMLEEGKLRERVMTSISNLDVGYADAVLPHWPGCGGIRAEDDTGMHVEARQLFWSVLCDMQKEKLVRYVGVSNYLPKHFDAIYREAARHGATTTTGSGGGGGISLGETNSSVIGIPALNQIELHPLCVQEDAAQHARAHNYVLQQYSPFGSGKLNLISHPQLLNVQQSVFPNHSVFDVLVMWGLSQGYCTLVRSKDKAHIAGNMKTATDFFVSAKMHDGANTKGGGGASGGVEAPLTAYQLDALRNLRHLMSVDRKKDQHLCWYSEVIE